MRGPDRCRTDARLRKVAQVAASVRRTGGRLDQERGNEEVRRTRRTLEDIVLRSEVRSDDGRRQCDRTDCRGQSRRAHRRSGNFVSRSAQLLLFLALGLATVLCTPMHRALVVARFAAGHLRLRRHGSVGDAAGPRRRRQRGDQHQHEADRQGAHRLILLVLRRKCQFRSRLAVRPDGSSVPWQGSANWRSRAVDDVRSAPELSAIQG